MKDIINENGMVLLGCGKMGSALLAGWLEKGIAPSAVSVIDPYPSDWLKELAAQGLRLNAGLPNKAAVCVLAVKPQMMAEALPQIAALSQTGTLFLSIAAGTPIAFFEGALGAGAAIVRAMPNTPAAIGRGITALIGNAACADADLTLSQDLLSSVGQTVVLESEDQMDAVTAVSGSGPAYVFHLIETLAAAGEAEGLSPELSLTLARATVAGSGALAEQSPDSPSQLRINVTSPGGTTAAALAVLMDKDEGFPALLNKAVKAAADRGRELAKS